MSKITLTGHIVAPAEDLDAVRAALPDHIVASRAEPGCLKFEMSEDPLRPGKFLLNEEFVDKAAFENHQQRTKESPWAAICKNIERSYDVTEHADD